MFLKKRQEVKTSGHEQPESGWTGLWNYFTHIHSQPTLGEIPTL